MSRLLAFLALLLAFSSARAVELQIKTADGQTLQGEYVGADDNGVKLKTKFGPVQIANKDVVSITNMATGKTVSAKGAAPEPPAAPKKGAEPPAAPAPPPGPPKVFQEIKPPDLSGAMAARLASAPIPEPDKNQRQELHRSMRNFGETNAAGRAKIIRSLRAYGRAAYPFIEAAYPDPWDLDIRVALLEALAAPGQPLTADIFADAHAAALAALNQAGKEPAPPPPDYLSKRDRERPLTRNELQRQAAQSVLDVEGFAAIAGGPYNALLLLDIYKKRYSAEKPDPLLVGAARDATRFASTAADAGRARSTWTPTERMLLIELVFPMLFKQNDDLADIAREFLKKALPAGHPKWDAPQDEWVEWWENAREKLDKRR